MLQRLLLAVWVGAMCASGLLAAPVLFSMLDDRALAGSVAGRLFAETAWLGLASGVLLLALHWWRFARAGWRFWSLCLMLVLVAGGQFVLAPQIAALRTAGLVDTPQFGQLHALSGVLFLVTLGIGLALVAAGPGDWTQSSASR